MQKTNKERKSWAPYYERVVQDKTKYNRKKQKQKFNKLKSEYCG